MECAGAGFVLICTPSKSKQERWVVTLSAVDGHVLWKTRTPSTWHPLIDGLACQNLKRFDPRTGEEEGSTMGYLAGRTCQSTAMSAHCIFVPCWFWFMGLAAEDDHKAKLTPFEYYGIRGACGEGAIPANGMLYLAQHNCKCVPGAMYGFLAVGPWGTWPAPEEFERARPVEKGPAFGTLDSRAVGPDDWPVSPHDAQRSAVNRRRRLPDKLKQLWRSQVVQAANGPLARRRGERD